MEGFKSSSKLPDPNYKDVYELLSDEEIYTFYIPNLVLNTHMESPIGAKDNKPSFSVFWSYRKHKFLFKEFRYGYTGDCIDFIRYKFSYADNTLACMRILRDFGLDKNFHIRDDIMQITPTGVPSKIIKPLKKGGKRARIKIVLKDWESHDLLFWNNYGITKEWLKRGRVFPISYFYLNGTLHKADKHAYAYVEKKDNRVTYKIYQPFNEFDRKWISNNDSSVWELWELLPQFHNFLLITKSRKDALSIMATAKIPSTSLQAEGTIPKLQVIKELKLRFSYIFLLYDNDFNSVDNWGVRYSTKLCNDFDFKAYRNIIIPDKYQSKDYTDFIDNHNKKRASQYLWLEIKKRIQKEFYENNKQTNTCSSRR